jgi:NAD+ kinase
MRMRLQVEVYSGGVARSVHVVLNELHLGRGASPVMTRIAAYVDDEPLTTVLSDGLIISTQTGSTAYALSAGGSILSPATRGIMFCPICPHTLSFRPLVLSDAAVLRLEVDEASRGACQATFDGRPESIPLRRGDYVLVRASPWPLPLLVHRGPTTDWLLGLHQKLLWNVRGDGFKSRLPAQRSAGAARGGGSGGSLEGASEEA